MKKEIYKRLENVVAIIICVLFSFFFLINSPLHPWRGNEAGVDSSVFKTVALMMEKGYMPYRDTFDHKGPLLYVINYLGNMISYYRGVWIIELLFFTVTVFFIYKISRLSSGKISSCIVIIISTSLLFGYLEGGNFTEEYALPFITISIYVFLDYLLNEQIGIIRIIACGMGLGAVLMLRPNMIAVWVVFCSFVFFYLLYKKDYKRLFKYIVFFLFGMCIAIVPFIIWLGINGSLAEFYEVYIVFNKEYTTSDGASVGLASIITAATGFAGGLVHTLAFVSVGYHIRKDKISAGYVYLMYMVFNILLIAVSGREFGHYGIIIVPAVAYPVSLMISDLEFEKNFSKKCALAVAFFLSGCAILFNNYAHLIINTSRYYDTRNEKVNKIDDSLSTIVDLVDYYTDDEDSISVYGNMDIVYVLAKRRHATRYSYQFNICKVNPEILDEYYEQLEEELPKIIVVQFEDDEIIEFLNRHAYKILWNGDKDNNDIAIYIQ